MQSCIMLISIYNKTFKHAWDDLLTCQNRSLFAIVNFFLIIALSNRKEIVPWGSIFISMHQRVLYFASGSSTKGVDLLLLSTTPSVN